MSSTIKNYYSLMKPSIIYGNLITTTAGFLLAYQNIVSHNLGGPAASLHFELLFATLIGISFVIASGCVFNNFLDRTIDAKMERTKNRALARGVIPARNAIVYGIVLSLIGLFVLALYTNLLALSAALVGFFFYVVMYSLWKRRSEYGVLIGSISGAVPPVVGYMAASNTVDAGVLILFMIFILWQIPHFYAISIYRLNEYTAASLPTLPAKKGIYTTKEYILAYIVAFTLAALSLAFFGYAGYVYLVTAAFLSLVWLTFALNGFTIHDDTRWARKMFFLSLIVLLSLCVAIGADAVLHIAV